MQQLLRTTNSFTAIATTYALDVIGVLRDTCTPTSHKSRGNRAEAKLAQAAKTKYRSKVFHAADPLLLSIFSTRRQLMRATF